MLVISLQGQDMLCDSEKYVVLICELNHVSTHWQDWLCCFDFPNNYFCAVKEDREMNIWTDA